MSERECDDCGGLLVWHDDEEVYRCHSCGAEEQAATPRCAECGRKHTGDKRRCSECAPDEEETTEQIGNAVPVNLAKALVNEALTGDELALTSFSDEVVADD